MSFASDDSVEKARIAEKARKLALVEEWKIGEKYALGYLEELSPKISEAKSKLQEAIANAKEDAEELEEEELEEEELWEEGLNKKDLENLLLILKYFLDPDLKNQFGLYRHYQYFFDLTVPALQPPVFCECYSEKCWENPYGSWQDKTDECVKSFLSYIADLAHLDDEDKDDGYDFSPISENLHWHISGKAKNAFRNYDDLQIVIGDRLEEVPFRLRDEISFQLFVKMVIEIADPS